MTLPPRIGVVVLAAGRSSRLGRPKQLLELGGQPVIRHTLQHVLEAAIGEVIVVIGAEEARVRAAISDLPVRVVVNPRFAEGQATSMIAGLDALPVEIDGALFVLGDQPTVGAALIRQIAAAFDASGAAVVQPRYRGKPGNPVMIGRQLFPELRVVSGDEGARSVIRAHHDAIAWVDVDADPPPDLDTDADYQHMQAIWPPVR